MSWIGCNTNTDRQIQSQTCGQFCGPTQIQREHANIQKRGQALLLMMMTTVLLMQLIYIIHYTKVHKSMWTNEYDVYIMYICCNIMYICTFFHPSLLFSSLLFLSIITMCGCLLIVHLQDLGAWLQSFAPILPQLTGKGLAHSLMSNSCKRCSSLRQVKFFYTKQFLYGLCIWLSPNGCYKVGSTILPKIPKPWKHHQTKGTQK